MSTPGCDACRVAPGFVCTGSPSSCRVTECGDGIVEGSESCDDGNAAIGDRCANCQIEPDCEDGTCRAVCGDGALFNAEECDDGNRTAGDGCDEDCVVEAGFVCTEVVTEPPPFVDIPITYRDFRGFDLPAGGVLPRGHIDFQHKIGVERGIVGPALAPWGPDRKPVYAKEGQTSSTTHGHAAFDQWYRDVETVNRTIPSTLRLNRQGNGTYVFESTACFPLDNRGWIGAGESHRFDHNFHFTSELRFWFTYDGNPLTLGFFGDDDVYVFINGRLAVDIGGVHGPENGSITINSGNQASFGLQVDGVYEVAVFQAERQTTGSQYKLTLAGFFPPTSRCESFCGDGIVTADEVCDDQVNDGSYGSCLADCSGRGPFCGDGRTTDNEVCDDGANVGAYGGCAPGCGAVIGCGDGIVQRPNERCDDGVNDGSYNGCMPGCAARGPFCGDRTVQPSSNEACDDGFNDGRYDGCTNQCLVGPRCGDAVLQGTFEACDLGDANNVGGYDGCEQDCSRGPFCGDEVVDVGEVCDSGGRNGTSGNCAADCQGLASFCGDGTVDNGEVCDDGVNDGAYNGCAPGCASLGPRCGDGIVQAGEQCDDRNTNNADLCFNNCTLNISG